MLSAHGTVTIRPREVVPVYREEWDATVTDYKYNLVNRDFVSRNGNLYQVKVQKPKEFVPSGIDPDSEVGEAYWEIFNKLAPSVTNFLVIIDEDGKPQTLLSGGRIRTKFLNIGSLNMSETRLWGGAEPMTGKGLALVNDPDDRKFVVYNDSKNYVEMFQRENEWGLKGVINGNVDNPVFQLGSTNKIGGMVISDTGIKSDNFNPSTMIGSCYAKNGLAVYASGSGILVPSSGGIQAGIITAVGDHIAHILGLEIKAQETSSGYGSLSNVTALKLSATNSYPNPINPPIALDAVAGDVYVRNGYFVGPVIPPEANMWGHVSGIWLTLQQTLVTWVGITKINIVLPNGARNGHVVVFHAGTGRNADMGIICSDDAKLNYRGTLYNYINVTNRRLTIIVRKIGGYWFATHEEEWTAGFGNN